MAVGSCTFSSDDIVIKSPNDGRLYRYIQLPNGLCALLVHDPEIYGAESAAGDEHLDDDGAEEEGEGSDEDDNEEEDEEEEEDEDGVDEDGGEEEGEEEDINRVDVKDKKDVSQKKVDCFELLLYGFEFYCSTQMTEWFFFWLEICRLQPQCVWEWAVLKIRMRLRV